SPPTTHAGARSSSRPDSSSIEVFQSLRSATAGGAPGTVPVHGAARHDLVRGRVAVGRSVRRGGPARGDGARDAGSATQMAAVRGDRGRARVARGIGGVDGAARNHGY